MDFENFILFDSFFIFFYIALCNLCEASIGKGLDRMKRAAFQAPVYVCVFVCFLCKNGLQEKGKIDLIAKKT